MTAERRGLGSWFWLRAEPECVAEAQQGSGRLAGSGPARPQHPVCMWCLPRLDRCVGFVSRRWRLPLTCRKGDPCRFFVAVSGSQVVEALGGLGGNERGSQKWHRRSTRGKGPLGAGISGVPRTPVAVAVSPPGIETVYKSVIRLVYKLVYLTVAVF